MNPPSPVRRLFSQILETARRVEDARLRPFLDLLADWGSEERALSPATFPVLDSLQGIDSFSSAATRDLAREVVALSAQLNWRQSFTEADLPADFLARYCWTDVVGAKGPLVSARVRTGLVLFGPEMYYPPHAHVAEELYIIVAGTANWAGGDNFEAARAPGSVVFHQSMEYHAMRTFAEPLLALYFWRGGDLIAKPFLTGEPGG